MSKKRLTIQTYKKLFDLHEDGYSIEGALRKLDIDFSPRQLTIDYHKYKEHGSDVLLPKVKNNTYSDDFKRQVVSDYLNDGLSLNNLLVKYNIPSVSTVNRWISQHLSGKILKTYSPKPEVYQLRSKSLSYEERVEIVDYYMSHSQSYKETANHFNIKYNQVYSWVQKYKKHGYDGLKDGRGKGKPKAVLSPEEALKLKSRYLKSEINIFRWKKRKKQSKGS